MAQQADMEKTSDPTSHRKLGSITLTSLVVGAIIGSGIFDLPQNMARSAGAGAILIAWAISFMGMFTLSKLFEWLSLNRQEIDDGVYGYARVGFGRYMGFNSAWGYWFSVWVGCGVGYSVMFFGTLGTFEPLSFFGDGGTIQALIGELIVIWAVHFMVLRGVRSAAIINTVMTVAKILPILVFIIFAALAFNIDTFKINFWGSPSLDSVLEQTRSTMLFTLWIFLGIECATVYNTRAKGPKEVGRATVYGFILTFMLLSSVSLLSLGVVPQDQLAELKTPSMLGVVKVATDLPWVAPLIKVGVLISLSGAMLAWTLISTEMLYLGGRGKEHTLPQKFGILNKADAPSAALWLTNTMVSLFLIYNCINASGYSKLIQLASSMALIPYWLCAAYALKTMYQNPPDKKKAFMFTLAFIGAIYSTWLIYAGGMKFLLLSMVLYAPGILLYIRASKEAKLPAFPDLLSKLAAVAVIVLGIIALFLLVTGELKL